MRSCPMLVHLQEWSVQTHATVKLSTLVMSIPLEALKALQASWKMEHSRSNIYLLFWSVLWQHVANHVQTWHGPKSRITYGTVHVEQIESSAEIEIQTHHQPIENYLYAKWKFPQPPEQQIEHWTSQKASCMQLPLHPTWCNSSRATSSLN